MLASKENIVNKKKGSYYLISSLLSRVPWVIHAFGLKNSSDNRNKNRFETVHDFVKSLGLSSKLVSEVDQVHSSRVIVVSEPGVAGKADGLVTNKEELILSVKTADCAPVLFCGTSNKLVGAIHIGWRGLVKGIVERFTETIKKEFGSKLDEVICAVGPYIKECCYEIGNDISGYFKHCRISPDGRIFLDLGGEIRDRLLNVGISGDNIEFLDFCTACNPEKFFSYRRDGGKTGRMYSIIMISH